MSPEEIANSEHWEDLDPWHRGRRTLKIRYGSFLSWRTLAHATGLDVQVVVATMVEIYFELTLQRKTWLSAQELSRRFQPGITAQLCNLGLAENRNGQVVLLDVERTVTESKMRRGVALRSLPAKRARDLQGKLWKLFSDIRGTVRGPLENDEAVIQLLRARGPDRTILERWKRALLSTEWPVVQTLNDLNREWERFA